MNNRWSDAARAAALAVRQKRAFAANPRKPIEAPKPGRSAPKPMAPKPMVYAGGSATFDESTGTRSNPGKNVWIPSNGGVGTQYEEGMKGLVAKKKLLASNKLQKPNIFYSSTGPQRPPPVSERYKDDWLTKRQRQEKEAAERSGSHPRPSGNATRVIIGGKRYTRVGNKLTPDVVEPGQKKKVFYEK